MLTHACVCVAAFVAPQEPTGDVDPSIPLPYAHAHNDYNHRRPLLDALDAGCFSVEADIVLVGGELMVAHERRSVRPGVTLEAAYLKPLAERIERNGRTVYPDGEREFQLLVDFKTGGVKTYEVLHALLERYGAMLTRFDANGRERGAVLVVLSGGYPRDHLFSQERRYCAGDGWFGDVEAGRTKDEVPLLSCAWFGEFSWLGHGAMPDEQFAKLVGLVERAHAAGRKIRFWGVPDLPAIWDAQLLAGVDWLDLDHLRRAAKFLRAHWAPPQKVAGRDLAIGVSRRVVDQFEPIEIGYGILNRSSNALGTGSDVGVLFEVQRHLPVTDERWEERWANPPAGFGGEAFGGRRIAPESGYWVEDVPDAWVSATAGRYRVRVRNGGAQSRWVGVLVEACAQNATVFGDNEDARRPIYRQHRNAFAGVPPVDALLGLPVTDALREFYAARRARLLLFDSPSDAVVQEILRLTESVDTARYGGATGGTGALALRVRAAALALLEKRDDSIAALLQRFPVRPDWRLPGESR